MLYKRIQSLTRSRNRKDKVALCLAGGGITGSMYEIGCLTALDDFLEGKSCVNQFDMFVGISAGAIVAAFIANDYKPAEMFNAIHEDQKSPLNFKRKNIYNLRLSEFIMSFAPLVKRLPALLHYGWVNRRHASVMDLLSLLQEFLPPGIFSLRNLDKFVTTALYPEGKTNDFRNLRSKLYIPATNLDTGARCVFGEEESTVPISKAVAASAAIPLFFRPFRINGADYIDGSTTQVSHLDIAIRNGAKLVIVINPTAPIRNDRTQKLLPTFDGKWGKIAQRGLGAISEQARRVETQTRFDLGLQRFRAEHPDVDYVILQPGISDGFLFLHGVMEFDSRRSILDHGYRTTLAELQSNEAEYKALFAKYGLTGAAG